METVFVVLAPDDKVFTTYDWSAFAGKIEPLFCGGETRRDSVYNGLVAAMADVQADDWVLVHDAARPCLPAADLARLYEECRNDEIGGILEGAAQDGGGTSRRSRPADAAQRQQAGQQPCPHDAVTAAPSLHRPAP